MSSKKQLRRKRQKEEEERPRGKVNPAVLFIVGIATVVLALVAGVALFGGASGPGEPPWPGAVWSPAHDHWH
jgi:hypothetical protein